MLDSTSKIHDLSISDIAKYVHNQYVVEQRVLEAKNRFMAMRLKKLVSERHPRYEFAISFAQVMPKILKLNREMATMKKIKAGDFKSVTRYRFKLQGDINFSIKVFAGNVFGDIRKKLGVKDQFVMNAFCRRCFVLYHSLMFIGTNHGAICLRIPNLVKISSFLGIIATL